MGWLYYNWLRNSLDLYQKMQLGAEIFPFLDGNVDVIISMISNVTTLFIYKLFLIYFDHFYFTNIISILDILATRILK